MNEEEMNEEALNTKYLVYGIVPTSGTQSPKGIVGVDGQSVFLLSHNGITAVVSRVKRDDAIPSLSRLLAYKGAVEAFHRGNMTGGMIPMRYGCMADDKTHIRSLLRKNRVHYTKLLKELAGCVEMGIRVLISECRVRSAECKISATHTPHSSLRNPKPDSSGRAYLAARKTHYLQKEQSSKQMEQFIERFRAIFSGLFVKWKAEVASTGSFPSGSGTRQVVSIYFLVPRDSLDRFRAAFRQAGTGENVKLLMSGPWPPYNFVAPDRAES